MCDHENELYLFCLFASCYTLPYLSALEMHHGKALYKFKLLYLLTYFLYFCIT